MKKKYGVIAGVARIGGGRDISIVRADENGVVSKGIPFSRHRLFATADTCSRISPFLCCHL